MIDKRVRVVLRAGFGPASSARKAYGTISWLTLRRGFVDYLKSQAYSSDYQSDLIHYLDQYITCIESPADIISIFSRVKSGRRHLWLGLRVLFNYLEILGVDNDYLNLLRKALPKVKCGIDLNVPSEEDILKSLRMLRAVPPKYAALHNILLDSGLRLIEAVKILTESSKAEEVNGFIRIAIGEFRGSKQAYYGYLTKETYSMLQQVNSEPIKVRTASHYYYLNRILAPKYLRKFAFDKMVSLDIPESVADFIEGRVAKRIGAKHYMALRRQADNFYGRYANHIASLRSQL